MAICRSSVYCVVLLFSQGQEGAGELGEPQPAHVLRVVPRLAPHRPVEDGRHLVTGGQREHGADGPGRARLEALLGRPPHGPGRRVDEPERDAALGLVVVGAIEPEVEGVVAGDGGGEDGRGQVERVVGVDRLRLELDHLPAGAGLVIWQTDKK